MRGVLFAGTLLLSSALIFLVQPLFAKLLLPELGGSSSVWTTCMLFFQTILLGGYAYAHGLTKKFEIKNQVRIHLGLLLIGLLFLPFSMLELPFNASDFPVAWLLLVLLLSVGWPFFVLSASAPLLQVWFTKDGGISKDPYFLYAASNVGSMVALIGFPFIVEPLVGVGSQITWWAFCYVALLVCIFLCSRFVVREEKARAEEREVLSIPRQVKWVLYAFVPSSLMLGLTQYFTTDIASIPLLWVGPLALYLLSFIFAFSRPQMRWFKDGLPSFFNILIPIAIVIPFVFATNVSGVYSKLAMHGISFFLSAWFFHSMLASDRPNPSELTRYFFLLSLGGVLGGLFNSVLSPLLFSRSVEYFFIALVGIALIPKPPTNDANPELLAALYSVFTLVGLWGLGFFSLQFSIFLGVALLATIGVAGTTHLRAKYANLALALGLLFGVHVQYRTPGLLWAERSFFGAYKVFDRKNGKHPYRSFSHGTTSHGKQSLEVGFENIPLSYHHPTGPAGQVFSKFKHEKVLVVGLGVGAMAAYAETGTRMRFYEIDPLIGQIAKSHFRFLADCKGNCEVLYGDGRKLIEKEKDAAYDLIMLDAYNSDSVPTHLLTKEAVVLYLKKLAPSGVLLFNASNRFISIEGVIGTIVKELGLSSRTRIHFPTKAQKKRKIQATLYVVVGRSETDLGPLASDSSWRETKVLDLPAWTDDYASVFGALK